MTAPSSASSDLVLARERLTSAGLAFALVRDGRLLATGNDHGARELLAAIDRLGAEVSGASLADKVVGKAVAAMVVHAGIASVDAALASQAAVEFLRAHAVPLQAETVVPLIVNRRGDGPCPLEALTVPIANATAAVEALREFFGRAR